MRTEKAANFPNLTKEEATVVDVLFAFRELGERRAEQKSDDGPYALGNALEELVEDNELEHTVASIAEKTSHDYFTVMKIIKRLLRICEEDMAEDAARGPLRKWIMNPRRELRRWRDRGRKEAA